MAGVHQLLTEFVRVVLAQAVLGERFELSGAEVARVVVRLAPVLAEYVRGLVNDVGMFRRKIGDDCQRFLSARA